MNHFSKEKGRGPGLRSHEPSPWLNSAPGSWLHSTWTAQGWIYGRDLNKRRGTPRSNPCPWSQYGQRTIGRGGVRWWLAAVPWTTAVAHRTKALGRLWFSKFSTVCSYGIASRWGFFFAYPQAAVHGVESGRRRLPSQKLDWWHGSPPAAVWLDQDNGQLPLDVH
jgi:hypothetical protein